MAALAISIVMALGGLAVAQDRDDYYRGGNGTQARQYGYNRGFQDGEKKGRHEGRENDPNDYHTPDWRQATRGYKDWMGSKRAYQNAYQQGYAEGFRSGFNQEARGWRGDRDRYYGYRDRGYRGNGYYGGGSYDYGNRVGYDAGYQDGITMAREDQYKNKPFNPNPRARFGDRDNGYRREYGDKDSYRGQYTEGYRAGYESTFYRRY
jgi:hypothetical protein